MPDNSFDVVSKIEITEVANAISQAMKEIMTRYDLKDSKSAIELNEKDMKLTLSSSDEFKLKAVIEILQSKLIKRNVAVKNFEYEAITPAAHNSVRQEVKIIQGIPMEKAKKIVALVKDSKKKAQASINGDLVRIASKDRDTLQEVMALLRGQDFGVEVQFTNFRSN